ncbi:MAG: hypothetical protein U9P44_01425 [archaeon]|nr:hypothetical protein [archaeon]
MPVYTGGEVSVSSSGIESLSLPERLSLSFRCELSAMFNNIKDESLWLILGKNFNYSGSYCLDSPTVMAPERKLPVLGFLDELFVSIVGCYDTVFDELIPDTAISLAEIMGGSADSKGVGTGIFALVNSIASKYDDLFLKEMCTVDCGNTVHLHLEGDFSNLALFVKSYVVDYGLNPVFYIES